MKNSWSQWLTTGLLVAAAFVIGILFTEVRYLRDGGARVGTAGTGTDVGTAPAPEADITAVRPVDDTDHVRGNANAPLTLIMYSDFECPFCAAFHPTLDQVLEEYGDDVRLVYRHYPLSFHPHAQEAAEASECIAEQMGNDGFWAFYDAIFAKQDELGGKLDDDSVTEVAQEIGANTTQLASCLESEKYADRVASDMTNGSEAGVTGTPGTFVLTADGDGELIPGAYPFAQVQTILDGYLN